MKKIYLYNLLLLLFFNACDSEPEKVEGVPNQDPEFEVFKDYFINELWKISPQQAVYAGYYDYAAELPAPSDSLREAQIAFANRMLDSLHQYDPASLSPDNSINYKMIENELESQRWYITTYQGWKWNPATYNVAGVFDRIIKSDFAPLAQKLEIVFEKMEHVPQYYAQARENIDRPSVPHTRLAIDQIRGGTYIFENVILDSLNAAGISGEQQKEMLATINETVESINAFANYLELEVLPELNGENSRNFRLGENLYEEKFKYDIVSTYTAKEIYEKARAHKDSLHREMTRISQRLWSKYFPGQAQPLGLQVVHHMLDTLSSQHSHRDSFMQDIEKQIPRLAEFVREKDLLYLDPSKPLTVRETPMYMRGIAGASISAPGPYDKDKETFYNVSPLNSPQYTTASAESFLREYNDYILQILNIHEAIPGHYAQLVYSNENPDMIRSILGNGATIEGWAVYGERMMLEAGYGKNAAEMWLMYYKWNLRTTCNTILDYSVHVLNMTEEQALNLLMNEAFQEEAEARGKWRRVQLSQVQLTSYFTGYMDIVKLRQDYQEKMGEEYSLKNFNETFLKYGSAPVKYIREAMLGERE
ncbi:MAG: DUF885 domain-containing protein [Bacteroidia bacterium]